MKKTMVKLFFILKIQIRFKFKHLKILRPDEDK